MKKLLLVWPTHREDWVCSFREWAHDFELFFLAGSFPNDSSFVDDFAEVLYWSEFRSAQDILDDIDPYAIVFMSIESGLAMTMNHTAQSRGIDTYVLQHGIYTNYRDYRNREKVWQKRSRVTLIKEHQDQLGFNSFQFVNKSLTGINKIWLLFIFLFGRGVKYVGPYWTARHFPLSMKKASKYLCFSPYNSQIHRETDRIKDSRIEYIGSAELQRYIKLETNFIDIDFYLHIDQALAENSFGEETVSKEKMISFYLKLNEFCLRKKAKLFIKLHPESYNSSWLPLHDNIVYLGKIPNFNSYIQSALGCFGFYSTMVIPAVYWKPTILFKVQYSALQEKLYDLVKVQILPFHEFESNDIAFRSNKDPELIESVFINKSPLSSFERIKRAIIDK